MSKSIEDSSPFACYGEILWQSPVRRIGKHDWRITLYRYRYHDNKPLIGYEWRKPADMIPGFTLSTWESRWRRDEDWPRYNPHDGMYAGLPRTLRRLWEQHRDEIERAKAKAA